jgi:hypothetical protein
LDQSLYATTRPFAFPRHLGSTEREATDALFELRKVACELRNSMQLGGIATYASPCWQCE